jgi:hypothetical protein
MQLDIWIPNYSLALEYQGIEAGQARGGRGYTYSNLAGTGGSSQGQEGYTYSRGIKPDRDRVKQISRFLIPLSYLTNAKILTKTRGASLF